jgi:UDP-N-acetylmuramoyl-L-alanyl-D-glutamate--2,6-diaminopimelate ligase
VFQASLCIFLSGLYNFGILRGDSILFALKEHLASWEMFSHILSFATGIVSDSRLVEPDNIFVALKGFRDNGNSYIREAVGRGASAVITEYPLDIAPGIPIFVVENARRILALLCGWFYDYPADALHVTAVTGTNGKTTTATMIDTILNQSGLTTGVIGTDKIKIASSAYSSPLTTPDAPTLHRYLHEMRMRNVSHVTMETSAQGIVMERVAGIPFRCGVLTNVSPDHFDFHGTFAAYIAAKKRFLGILAADAPLCINADDAECIAISRHYTGPIITYGIHTAADITAADIMFTPEGCEFFIVSRRTLSTLDAKPIPPFSCFCRLNVHGTHNIYNALAATAVCLLYQILPDAIVLGLSRFKGVERRMQIRHLHDFTVIDDTALNPGSIDAVFQTIGQIPYQRLILVTAIRGNRGTAINHENALQFIKWSRYFHLERIIVTSSHSHIDSWNCVTAAEEAAFLITLSKANLPFAHFRELPDAITFALKHIQPGDLLLLIGPHGMDAATSVLENLLAEFHTAIPDEALDISSLLLQNR